MPFVASADAPNAHLTRVSLLEPSDPGAVYRVPLIASPAMRLVLLEFPAGFRTIPHRHPGAGEYFFILGGSGIVSIGRREPIAVTPGDLLFAGVDEVHTLEAGPGGLRFLAGVGPNEDRPDEAVEVGDAGTIER